MPRKRTRQRTRVADSGGESDEASDSADRSRRAAASSIVPDEEDMRIFKMWCALGASSVPDEIALAEIWRHPQRDDIHAILQGLWRGIAPPPRAPSEDDREWMKLLDSMDVEDRKFEEVEMRHEEVMAEERETVRKYGKLPAAILDIDRLGQNQLKKHLREKGFHDKAKVKPFDLGDDAPHAGEAGYDAAVTEELRKRLREVWKSEVPEEDEL